MLIHVNIPVLLLNQVALGKPSGVTRIAFCIWSLRHPSVTVQAIPGLLGLDYLFKCSLEQQEPPACTLTSGKLLLLLDNRKKSCAKCWVGAKKSSLPLLPSDNRGVPKAKEESARSTSSRSRCRTPAMWQGLL